MGTLEGVGDMCERSREGRHGAAEAVGDQRRVVGGRGTAAARPSAAVPPSGPQALLVAKAADKAIAATAPRSVWPPRWWSPAADRRRSQPGAPSYAAIRIRCPADGPPG